MTGASVRIAFDDAAVRSAMQALTRIGKGRAGLAQIGETLVQSTRERFHRKVGPDGAAWRPWSPGYAALRSAPGIEPGLRPETLLVRAGMRGGLMGSITYAVQGDDAVEVGTNKVYAAVHQFGAVIRPRASRRLAFRAGADGGLMLARQVTIPARPFLGVSAADRTEIRAVLIEAAEALVAAARPA